MLKHIPFSLSPEVVKTMMEMGRGDEIVFADANFPSADMKRVIRTECRSIPALLADVLELVPLDPSGMYATVLQPSDEEFFPPVWQEMEAVATAGEEAENFSLDKLEKYSFEKRCACACCVVVTSDTDPFATVILKKGSVC